jgi:hypothetical protein
MRISQERLKSLVEYCPQSGIFTWKNSPRKGINGKVAGTKTFKGYIMIEHMNKGLYAHRLAWIYMYGEDPDCQIDHINRVKDDNRICNLRLCTQEQNLQNYGPQKNNTSGYRGVYFDKKVGKWFARITIWGKKKHLGYFDTAADADVAVRGASVKTCGEFSYASV